jgi:hypothetical protein
MRFVVDKVEMAQILMFSPVCIIPSSSTCCFYQIDKLAKPGNLTKSNALSKIGEHWIEKCFQCFRLLKSTVQVVWKFYCSESFLVVLPRPSGKVRSDATTILQAR